MPVELDGRSRQCAATRQCLPLMTAEVTCLRRAALTKTRKSNENVHCKCSSKRNSNVLELEVARAAQTQRELTLQEEVEREHQRVLQLEADLNAQSQRERTLQERLEREEQHALDLRTKLSRMEMLLRDTQQENLRLVAELKQERMERTERTFSSLRQRLFFEARCDRCTTEALLTC